MIKQFPTIEDRTEIHQLINDHSKGIGTRNEMMRRSRSHSRKIQLN